MSESDVLSRSPHCKSKNMYNDHRNNLNEAERAYEYFKLKKKPWSLWFIWKYFRA